MVDFICLEARLVVELDGEPHATRREYDARRDAYLRAQGWRVIRFQNESFLQAPTSVCEAITVACA